MNPCKKLHFLTEMKIEKAITKKVYVQYDKL